MTTARACLDEAAAFTLDAWRALGTMGQAQALGQASPHPGTRAAGPIAAGTGKEPSFTLGSEGRK